MLVGSPLAPTRGRLPCKMWGQRSRANICFLWMTHSQEQEERTSLGNVLCFFFPTHHQIIDSTLLPGEGWGTGWKDARKESAFHSQQNLKNGKEALLPNIRWLWRVAGDFMAPPEELCCLTPNHLLGQLWWNILVFPWTLKQPQENAFNWFTPVLYSTIFVTTICSKLFILS